MNLLPYAYALLVFGIITFLFFLLGRMFLNVETIYEYDFEVIIEDNSDYGVDLQRFITERGKRGWKYERCERIKIERATASLLMLIFVKTKNRIRLFS